MACYQGRNEVVKLLIEKGVDIHVDNRVLFIAIERGFTEIVKLLLDSGANAGRYALRVAMLHDHTDIIKLLENNKSDI